MEVNGCYLTIESIKKVSKESFVKYMTTNLMSFIEERNGDFTVLETDDGKDYFSYLLNEYEEGER